MSDVILPSQIEFLAPGSLVPHQRNARTHSPEQIEQVAASMREFGFTVPVIIDDDGVIMAGHGRVLAATKIGMDRIPCIRLQGLSKEQRRAYVIADNKLAENAGWDRELLALELGDLRDLGFDLGLIGFDGDELAELFLDEDGLEQDGETDDDAIPLPGKEPVSVQGDVWICGEHRVMCGDSTVRSDFEKLMGDGLADMCWTDPPYNVNYKTAAGSIKNDDMEAGAFLAFLSDAFVSVFSALKEGGAFYVAHADTEGLAFRTAFASGGFKLSGCLVWVKPSLVLGRSDYQWRHEPILYGWKPGAAHRWFGGRKQTTVIDVEDPPFVIMSDGSIQIDAGSTTLRISGADLHFEEVVPSILKHEKPARNLEHPTMKPVGLILTYLKNSSRRGDVVLDPFGGYGSTLIAAQKVGRTARLMELDEVYADVIVRRWQDFTGETAMLEGTDETFAAAAGARVVTS